MSDMPPDIEQYVAHQLSIGKFPSRAALEIDAMRLHREREQRQEKLKAEIQVGIDELDRGLGKPLDIDEICSELDRELDDAGQPRKCQV